MSYDKQLNDLLIAVRSLGEGDSAEIEKPDRFELKKSDIEFYLYNFSKNSKRYIFVEYKYSYTIIRLHDNTNVFNFYKSFLKAEEFAQYRKDFIYLEEVLSKFSRCVNKKISYEKIVDITPSINDSVRLNKVIEAFIRYEKLSVIKYKSFVYRINIY